MPFNANKIVLNIWRHACIVKIHVALWTSSFPQVFVLFFGGTGV
jgi:hypothetical protein